MPRSRQSMNELLVSLAQQGKNVCRLKGGDPFVFGRGGEEIMTLNQHNIPWEVVPGISSCIAIPELAGISVAYFDVNTFDDYLHMLKICTEITGHKELYEENGTKIQAQVDKAIARADDSAPTVLYLRGSATSVKVKSSKGSVLGEMLKDMKCSNIADTDKSLLEELSLERIMELDPQYIFIVKQGNDEKAVEENLNQTILTHPAWKELTAVKEGSLYYMDSNLYNLKPNDRWGEAYEKLADILYPA